MWLFYVILKLQMNDALLDIFINRINGVGKEKKKNNIKLFLNEFKDYDKTWIKF